MSNMHSPPFERINKLVEEHGEKGLKLLFIFKIIKNAVVGRIEEEKPDLNWAEYGDEINRECMKVSKEILNKSRERPSEEDIKRVLSSLKSTMML